MSDSLDAGHASSSAENLTSLHWGVYRPRLEAGRLVELQAASWDSEPSPIGRSVPEALYSPSRIRRPAVRKGYLENPCGGGAKRGQEAFVEVDWDTALDLVAAELQRVREQHGNRAIFGGSYGWASAGRFHHAQSQLHRFLNGFGGYVYSKDSYSLGAGRVLMPHIVGGMDWLLGQHTSWENLAQHCELFVAFGGLPAKNTQVGGGGASDHRFNDALQNMARAGVRFVNVSPLRSDLEGVDNVQWLALRPGSDTALMIALAHVLISEGLHDQAFIDRYSVGFAAVRDYVLGIADGQPKTPEWASALSDIPATTIIELARQMAAKRTMINIAYSLQRARHGEQPFWMIVVLATLLGQIGLPGGGFGLGYGCMNATGSGRKLFSGPRLDQGQNAVSDFIPVARITDMLLNPGTPFDYNGERLHYPDIRLIYWAGGNAFHHHQDLNRLIQAWQKPDTIIVQEQYWTAQARYADIVLPATTSLERNDIGSASSDRFMIAMKQAVPPVDQARDDYRILCDLAQRLGFADAFSEGRDEADWLRYLYEQSRPRAEQQAIALPGFDQFWRDGSFEISAPEKQTVMLEAFRRDPQRHPLPTPSGKLELFSERIASFGYDDCPGHPVWFERAPSAYPLHLISNQPKTRLHSQYDHGSYSRSLKIQGREPLTMHPDDAACRGIRAGSVVRVFNDKGALLAGVRLSEAIRPGVVQLATGAWYDPLQANQPGSLEIHGNPNVLTHDVGASQLSQGCTAQSCTVEIQPWQDELPRIKVFDPPHLLPLS